MLWTVTDEIARANPPSWPQEDRDAKADTARSLFGIGFVKSDTCVNCHLTTNRPEANKLTHLVNIRKGMNLQKMLDASMTSQLEGFTCSRCESDSIHTQKYLVNNPPEILMIQPNRWLDGADFGKKNERHVRFTKDEIIDITPHLDEEARQRFGELCYQLSGVILHFGTATSGHYISLVRDHIGKWRMYDDTRVLDIDAAQWGKREVRQGFTGSLYAFLRVGTAARATRLATSIGSIAHSVLGLLSTPPRTPLRSRSSPSSISTSPSSSSSISASSSSASASSSGELESSSSLLSSKPTSHELTPKSHNLRPNPVPVSVSSRSPSPAPEQRRRHAEGTGSGLLSGLRFELEIARTEAANSLAVAQLTWEEAHRNDAEHRKWATTAQDQIERLKETVKNLKQKLTSAEATLMTANTARKLQAEFKQVRDQLSSLQKKHAYLDEHNQRLHMIAARFVVKQRQHDGERAKEIEELARRERDIAELRQCCHDQAISLKEQEIILHRQMEAQLQSQNAAQIQSSPRKYPASKMKEDTARLKERIGMLPRQVLAGEDETITLKTMHCNCHVPREIQPTQKNAVLEKSCVSMAGGSSVNAAEGRRAEENAEPAEMTSRDKPDRNQKSASAMGTPRRRAKTLRRNGSLPHGSVVVQRSTQSIKCL